MKIKLNKILFLVLLLQIFSNFNTNVFCSRANNQSLLIANSLAKYAAFAASDAYGLRGEKSTDLYFDNTYLALDIFDSMLKIDNILGGTGTDAEVFALACDVGLLIYDIVLLGKNTNELNKLKNDKNNKKKKNGKIANPNLTQSNKKKIFYTLLRHSAALADLASTIDFAGDSGKLTKSSEAILSIFLKVFSRCIDNKSAQIPNKALACLSAVASSFATFAVFVNKADEKYREKKHKHGDTFYDLFGVSSDADLREINRNYKKMVLKIHPDKGGSVEVFQVIGNAKETLLDPVKRAEYDSLLRMGSKLKSDYNIPDQVAEEIKKIREEIKI